MAAHDARGKTRCLRRPIFYLKRDSDAAPAKGLKACSPRLLPNARLQIVKEVYALVFGEVYSLESGCAQYFNVLGPRQDRTSAYSVVLSMFMLAVLQGTL